MEALIDAVVGNLGSVIGGVIATLLAVLVGLAFKLLRRLPAVLDELAQQVIKRAKDTDTPIDDVAGQILLAVAEGLREALAKELPPPKAKK